MLYFSPENVCQSFDPVTQTYQPTIRIMAKCYELMPTLLHIVSELLMIVTDLSYKKAATSCLVAGKRGAIQDTSIIHFTPVIVWAQTMEN